MTNFKVNSMEVEVRFYFPLSQYEILIAHLNNQNELLDKGCFYEKTLLFDNPNPDLTFYSKEVDGRFRIRVSKHMTQDQQNCIVSWKKRTHKPSEGIHKEEEVELKVLFEEYNNLIYLISNVIQMKRIESYERYRYVFSNHQVEICVDKFPFGVALELELKNGNQNSSILLQWLKKLGLNIKDSYALSCDDKYKELCAANNITPKKDILFDDEEMPFVEDYK